SRCSSPIRCRISISTAPPPTTSCASAGSSSASAISWARRSRFDLHQHPFVPAQAGTQIASREQVVLDSRFRGNERTKSPSLRRDHAQPLGLALRTRLAAPEPDLHAVEIKINDRRGVERQQLAQRETADHGVAERLAQLRARAVTEG